MAQMGLLSFLYILLPLHAAWRATCAPATTVDVKLSSGIFRGVSTPGVTDKFLGIPFAVQPVGNLRFKAPVPITQTSNAIVDASTFGHACPQPASTGLGAPVGEDCLHLNVNLLSSTETACIDRPHCRYGVLKARAQRRSFPSYFGCM